MLLIKKGLSNIKSKMNVIFEKVADDLLMVSLTNQIENKGIPSYWRLTKTIGIPPLEIGIDCQQGLISCVTFFIDGAAISGTEDINNFVMEGNVIVDTDVFKKDNDFYDVNQSYNISICKNKLSCFFVPINDKCIAYRNDRIEIFVNLNNCIVGFSVCDLSEDEKDLIKSIR